MRRFCDNAVMRAAGILFAACIVAACAGCAAPIALVPDENIRLETVSLSAAPAFENAFLVDFAPDDSASGEAVFAGSHGEKFAADRAEWSETLALRLAAEMERRGAQIGGSGAPRFILSVKDVASVASEGRVEVTIRATLKRENGSWAKEYAGSDRVPYSAMLAFQGAIENLFERILTDKEFHAALSPAPAGK